MRVSIFPVLLALSLANPALADSGAASSAQGSPAAAVKPANAFTDLDRQFVQTYSAVASEMQKKNRPMLVVNGFTFTLLCEDGTQKSTAGKISHFDELKGVSHLGAYLYAIANKHWTHPEDNGWLDDLSKCKQTVEQALGEVDTVDWKSDAWPGGETKLKEFIRSSLQIVQKFSAKCLSDKVLSKEDYARFAKDYTPTMQATFYLDTLGGAYETIKILKEWKREIGDEKWNRMHVIVAGSQGRTTAALTRETNPSALFVSSLMNPDAAAKNIVIAPAAANMEQALQTIGMIITASDLADTMFGTAEAQKESGNFYKDLKSSELPLALQNVKSVLKDLPKGTARDPVLGIGPGKLE